MAVRDEDVEEPFVASSRAFLVTGTHLSTEHVHRVSSAAIDRARRHGVATVLDIDYRPVLWGLTQPAAGEQRFVRSDRVTSHLQQMLPRFDVVVGTEEEFRIAGGREDLVDSLRAVRALTPAVLAVKLGARGSAVFDGEGPPRIEEEHVVPGFPVRGMNVLGAGDAFMAGLLKGWLTGASWREAARMANACGALVVARHACSASMPTPEELEYFMGRPGLDRPDQDAHLARLHRVSRKRERWDDLAVLAFDHRAQFKDLAQEAGAAESRIPELKALLVRAAAETEESLGLQGHVGALLDDTYGEDALFAASGRGWWVGRPVEVPGSRPLQFEGGRSIGTRLTSWPRDHVVKCLVRFHPDDPADLRAEQETQLRALYGAVQESGHELLVEVIPPTEPPCDDRTIARALDRIYEIGIYPEWWKLAPMSRESWKQVDDLVARRDPWCRGCGALPRLPAGREPARPGSPLRRGLRDLRARQCRGPGRGLVPASGDAAHLACAQRAGNGARRDRVREGPHAPAHDGCDDVDRPRRDESGDRRGHRARQPAPRPLPAGRRIRLPRPGPGPPAGGGLPRCHGDRERLPASSVALLRPHRSPRAARGRAPTRPPGADGCGALRPGDACDAAGRADDGLGVPGGLVRAAHRPVPCAAAGRRRARRRGRGAAAREAAPHRR